MGVCAGRRGAKEYGEEAHAFVISQYELGLKEYKAMQKRAAAKRAAIVYDDSDTAVITFYEERLLIRNVSLKDFEKRLKKLVFNSEVIKLKQMKECFAGETNLETIVNDKDCLDWRLLFDDNFLAQQEDDKLDLQ